MNTPTPAAPRGTVSSGRSADHSAYEAVLAAVAAAGYGVVDVSTREADLEDVFLNLTRAANG